MKSFFSLLFMAFRTRGCFYKVQDCVFIKPASFTLSKLILSFFDNLDKFAGTLAPLSRFFNILTAIFANFRAPLKIYSNKDVWNIIYAVIEAKSVATKNSCECCFKACFFDAYKTNNHMACNNFCQQCKNYFAIAKAIESNCIFLQHFSSRTKSVFVDNSISRS